ncbi:hypothetical protein R1flu_005692 [Riccia fluitans]|uniref:Uncharacterized protein n=1 Tax=Riccia fluitans TaxID=41844 RepID=A0ABD1YU44_9MARC
MSFDGGGERHVGPPRTLEIQKFTAARSGEVQGLYAAVKSQVEAAGGDSSSFAIARHLRRRTTSHNRRVPYWILNERKKNRVGHASQNWTKKTKKKDGPSASEGAEKRRAERPPPSRRVRRRAEFQRVRRGEDIVQRDGTRRLATHVWHAKRFPMKKCWGYALSEGLPGRGRGSRAVLKWIKEAAVLHDASYYGLIELQGTSEAIGCILQQTVEPAVWFPSSGSPLKKAEAHGLLSGNAVLYHVGKAPYDAIAPITFLWRPPASDLKHKATEPEEVQVNVSGEERQLWIWIHPGAYDSALHCLAAACEKQAKDNPVNCRSRRSEFARLEILGSKATEVIRKVIHPTSREFETPRSNLSGKPPLGDGGAYPADGDIQQPKNLEFFSKIEFLPSSAVLALDVLDPRSTSSFSLSGSLEADGGLGEGGGQGGYKDIYTRDEMEVDTSMRDDDTQDGPINGEGHSLPRQHSLNLWASWLNMAEEGLSREVSDSVCLWNPDSGVKGTLLGPMSEKLLCKKRHDRRKKFLQNVDQTVSTNSNARNLQNRSSVCPVLLLRSSKSFSPSSGWTIILPIKWAHAFWIPLVFAGGRVIGLRERHWLATNAGIPHFPHDFPDCSTYAQLLTVDIAASDEANKKRPPAKRKPCLVVSPLQASILKVFEYNSRGRGDTNTEGMDSSRGDFEKISCRSGNEQSMRNLEEPQSARQSTMSASDYRQDDAVMAASFPDIVSNVVEGNSDTVVSQTCISGVLVTSKSSLETEDVLRSPGSLKMDQLRSMIPTGATSLDPVNHKLVNTSKDEVAIKACGLTEKGLTDHCEESIKPGYEMDRTTTGGLAGLPGASQADLLRYEAPSHEQITFAHAAEGGATTEQNFVIQDCDTMMRQREAANAEDGLGFMQPESSAGVVSGHDSGGPSVTESAALQDSLPVKEAQTKLLSSCSSIPFTGNALSSAPALVDSLVGDIKVPLSRREEVPVVSLKPDDILPATGVNSGSLNSDETAGCVAEEAKDRAGGSGNENGSRKVLSFFIARTQDVLLETLNRSGFQNALLLHQGITSQGTIKDALQQGKLRWAASSEGAVRAGSTSACAVICDEEKICYTRVLVSIPRKGTMEEGAVIFSPNEEDLDMFFRFKDWQGPSVMQPRNVKRKRKCKKSKMVSIDDDAKHGTVEQIKGTYENADACCEAWSNNRRSIGLITSSVPRGSTGPCIGVCDVGALMTLRGGQSGDPRWWDRKDIFVLAGNKYSSKLRPALISLPLERAESDIEWL